MTYVAQKQVGAAGDMLQREVQARSNDPLLYHELAQVYLLLDKHDQAVSTLQRALTLAPGNPDTALLLADVYTEANEPEPAIHLLNDLIQKHRQDPSVLFRAGMLFEKLQRWKEAQEAYEGAVRLDDDNALAKNNLAWLLASRGGNIDVALSLAQKAKAVEGMHPEFAANLRAMYEAAVRGERPTWKGAARAVGAKGIDWAIRTTTRPV